MNRRPGHQELKGYFLAVARSTYDQGFGEWDSSIYYPYVVSCWLGMNEYADDPDVRSAAPAVLDWTAATVALRTSNGVFGGAEQRGAGLQGSGRSNLDHLAWLWWGGLPGGRAPEGHGSDYGQLVYAATSHYRSPPPVVNLALKRLPRDISEGRNLRQNRVAFRMAKSPCASGHGCSFILAGITRSVRRSRDRPGVGPPATART